jgi:hypoxanthine phosphoribosyltransferase
MKTLMIKDKRFTELFSETELKKIVNECIDGIKKNLSDTENLVLIGVLNGGIPFMNEIAFSLPENITIDYVKAVSYGDNMYSSGEVRLLLDTQVDVRGRDVLIVDDIIDSGRTTKFLKDHFQLKGARSVRLCCLFFKKNDRMSEPDYFGSYIGDDFIVGFGLDYAQKGRNIKRILKLSD